METDLYILNIDTRYKTDPNSNAANYSYSLVNPLKNISSIKLSSLEFPNVNYIFSNNKNSNSFKILFRGTTIPIVIPEGIYSPCSIVDAINLIFTNLTKQAYSSTATTHFKMYYNSSTLKTYIVNDVPFGLDFDNTYPNGIPNNNKSLGQLLGFRQTSYTDLNVQNIPVLSTIGNTAGYGFTSESVLDTQGDTYILVKINNYGNIMHDSVDSMLVNGVNTLVKKTDNYFAKILLYGPKGTIIFDTAANFISKTVNLRQPENISKLQITLHEPNGDVIQLLNFDYSLTLEFTYILSSNLKKNSDGGLLNTSKITTPPAPQTNVIAPSRTPATRVEPFTGLDSIYEDKPVFKNNKYINTLTYDNHDNHDNHNNHDTHDNHNNHDNHDTHDKIYKSITLNDAQLNYVMNNPNIMKKTTKKSKGKKNKKKYIINY